MERRNDRAVMTVGGDSGAHGGSGFGEMHGDLRC
jgi:hypothetical protein